MPPVAAIRSGAAPVRGGLGTGGKGKGLVTNIYRATFGDADMHATAVKKRPDTYTSGSTDWTA